ncbi:MAG: trypsin-like serine protease [Chloroflexi bacterium]|nr:trypsin-like serine protease [Chloroflexota bacterium]
MFALGASIALTFALVGVVSAITDGEPDGGAHPYVGLAVFDDIDGKPMWRCSGTLIAPRVFLTAGHCTESPAVRATIWFEEDVESGIPGNGYPFSGATSHEGTAYTHPDYNTNAFYLFDFGVVILDDAVTDLGYAVLPTLGVLVGLATKRGRQDTTITAVGYGLQQINPVFAVAQRVRLKATLNLVDLNGTAGIPAGTSVMLSGNHHTGGTCFGDSGGPQFLSNTNVVVAVTSFGLNGNCAGVGGGYRVDTADDLDWLYGTFGAELAE